MFERDEPFVFVSFASEDRNLAEQVEAHLQKHGVRCWLYPTGIPAGNPSWLEYVRLVIKHSCLLVLIVTPNTKTSDNVQQEVALAYGFEKEIVPVWMKGKDSEYLKLVWDSFSGIQHCDCRALDTNFAILLNQINILLKDCDFGEFDSMLVENVLRGQQGFDAVIDWINRTTKSNAWRNPSDIRGLLRKPSDRIVVRPFLKNRIVRQLEEMLIRDRSLLDKMLIFLPAFLGVNYAAIATENNISEAQVKTTIDEVLPQLKKDDVFVARLNDWQGLGP